jgi:hypothetical protein
VESDGSDINCDTVVPVVSRQEWPKLRDAVNRDAARVSPHVRVYMFGMETSYDAMLVYGSQCLLDNFEDFERGSFPAKFPFRTGGYCEKCPTHVSFPEYYHHLSRVHTHNAQTHAVWLVWCKLIDKAAQWPAQRVFLGMNLEERRHNPFVENVCAICGPTSKASTCAQCQLISYCNRDHQRKDWPRHKKYCKKAFAPGCPL